MRIGVDTGGTFTDCVMFAGSEIRILKVFSTPADSSGAVLEGVARLAEGEAADRLDVIHGTTVGTNSLLERRGARVALVTTAGFEDLIEIGRQARPSLYDLNAQREPPLVPRSMRWGVRERTTVGGLTLSRPRTGELRRVCAEINRARAESIAVCFLFSFTNPANERATARVLRGLGIPVSVSHEILPEFREYERLSTVTINAYLAPRLGAYLARLQAAFESGNWKFESRNWRLETGKSKMETGNRKLKVWSAESLRSESIPRAKFPVSRFQFLRGGRLYVMQSSGGITTVERAAREPVRTILSGPAGGVAAASWIAEMLGISRAISFDMGGTSTDVCLLSGRPQTTHETTLGGLSVAVPVLDVRSVGAGGGSLARIDAGGALRVGPESSGAVPGPICYGRGGALPTVTDANLLLGRLDPDYFLGGTFRLDLAATEKAFLSFLQRRPGRPGSIASNSKAFRAPLELAGGIISVVDATMERALRVISVERGHDPRDFALICFGGAGGLHAADLARSLGMASVIVPQNPGGFSALGVLISDIVKDVSQSVLLTVPGAEPRPKAVIGRLPDFVKNLERRFKDLERAGRTALKNEGFSAECARCDRQMDIRYAGQAYELSIPFRARFPDLFHEEHKRAYGHAQPGRALEVVNLRVRLTIPTPKPRLETRKSKLETRERGVAQSSCFSNSAAVPPRQAAAPSRRGLESLLKVDAAPSQILSTEAGRGSLRYLLRRALIKRKAVWFEGQWRITAVYSRDRLPAGARFRGPAVVVEYSSTTVVPSDYECTVDKYLNLVLARRDR
jgi:N-methylhydantoinase A